MLKDKLETASKIENLQRLYPNEKDSKIILKILECRKEHNNRGLILDGFKKIVYPIVKDAFLCLQQHCTLKNKYLGCCSIIKLHTTIELLLSKHLSNGFYTWVRTYRLHQYNLKKDKRISQFNYSIGYTHGLGFLRIRSLVNLDARRRSLVGMAVEKFLDKRISFRFCKWKNHCKKIVEIKKCIENLGLLATKYQKYLIFQNIFEKFSRKKEYCVLNLAIFKLEDTYKKTKIRMFDYLMTKVYKNYKKLTICKNYKRKCFRQIFLLTFSQHFQDLFKKIIKSIKNLTTSSKKDQKLKKTFTKIGKRYKFLIFKSIIYKEYQSKKGILIIKNVLSQRLKDLLLKFQCRLTRTKKKLNILLLSVNEILSKHTFQFKYQTLKALKASKASKKQFLEQNPINYGEELPEDDFVFKSYLHIKKDPIESNSIQLTNSESGSMISHTKIQNRSSFASGELMKYHKYLLDKKKLDMIQEDNSIQEKEKKYSQTSRILNKTSKKIRPPWKPSSFTVDLNRSYKQMSVAAKILEAYKKNLNPEKVPDRSKDDDEFDKKNNSGPLTDRFDSNFRASPIERLELLSAIVLTNQNVVDIGLGVVIVANIWKKNIKSSVKKIFSKISSYCPSKNSRLLQNKKHALIKSSWRSGLSIIGIQKLKKVIKNKHKKLFISIFKL